MPQVSVVLPCFQLGEVIRANALRVAEACVHLDPQVIVVDDGSSDETYTQAGLAAKQSDRITVIRHPRNLGKGEALVSGWKAAEADLVVFLDGDLDLPPEQLVDIIPLLAEHDLVVGAKRQNMTAGGYPPIRRILSRFYAEGASRLFRLPVRETQTGLKVFRKTVLDDVLPRVANRGWAFDLELLARAERAGYRMTETPVIMQVSERGAPIRISMIWALARDSLRLAWRLRR